MENTEKNELTKVPYSQALSDTANQIQAAQNNWVTVSRGYSYNYLTTLIKIDLYYASIYVKGTRDSDNFKKIFSNISKYRVNTATKAINIGTKDVRVSSEEGESYYPSWFFQKELHQYMKENEWGELFNKFCDKLPRYGTIIVKDVNGKLVLVPLRTVLWDQALNDISKSTFVNEKHVYTFDEFRSEGQALGWNPTKVEQVIALYTTKAKFEKKVIEHYGFIKEAEMYSEERSESKEYIRGRCMVAGLEFWDNKMNPQKDVTNRPIVLEAAEVEEWPYLQHNWDEEDGRSLGVGVMEDLFQDQELWNDVTHMERKSLHWSTKKYWQTRDEEAPANLFTEAHTGDVLTGIKDEIKPVPMEERNLPQYNLVYGRLKEQANQKAFSYEVATGEQLNSGTPFRMGALLSNAVNSHFAYKREKLGLFIEKLIWRFVVPGFKKDRYEEHVVVFDGTKDELDTLSKFFIDAWVMDEVEKQKKATGFYPTVAEFDMLVAKATKLVQSKDRLHATLPRGFYDTVRIKVKVDVSGQDTNPVDMESMVNIFEVVGKNPAVLDDPRISRLLDLIANQAGQNPKTLFGMAKGAPMPSGGAMPGGPALNIPSMPGGAPPLAVGNGAGAPPTPGAVGALT